MYKKLKIARKHIYNLYDIQIMSRFQMLFILSCFIQSNFAQGPQTIFPEIEDTFEDKTPIPITTVNGFTRMDFSFNSDNKQRRKSPFSNILNASKRLESQSGTFSGIGDIKWSARGDRLSSLRNSLSTIDKVLQDSPLETPLNSHNSETSRTSSEIDYLRGVIVPSFMRQFYTTNEDGALISSSFLSLLYYRRNIKERVHRQQSGVKSALKQSMPSRSAKRNSAITPPSRDWCRLIGYRVCPRSGAKRI